MSTGKSKNLAKTSVFKDFFNYIENGHFKKKKLVFRGNFNFLEKSLTFKVFSLSENITLCKKC